MDTQLHVQDERSPLLRFLQRLRRDRSCADGKWMTPVDHPGDHQADIVGATWNLSSTLMDSKSLLNRGGNEPFLTDLVFIDAY